jgi:cobalt/nickel transport system permease protein
MHIPDGYLSPQTAIPMIAVMVPILGVAANKVKNDLKKKQIPVLAAGAAFSFVIMMFNLPIPGGSSAHAVGAVLLAILLGPWAACLGVSVALIIQALVDHVYFVGLDIKADGFVAGFGFFDGQG